NRIPEFDLALIFTPPAPAQGQLGQGRAEAGDQARPARPERWRAPAARGRQKWSALEDCWGGYLAVLTAEALERVVHKKSPSSGLGKRWEIRRANVLLHVCTHAHYTAAQVVNMLRQTGVENLPETMLISLARHEAT